MLELAAAGAKVLYIRAVEYARRHGVTLHVRSSFNNNEGTWVVNGNRGETMEEPIITGVAGDLSEAKITVVGVPDDYHGQYPKAFIKLRSGEALSSEALIKFLEDKLSPMERPREVEFRDELPKSLIGKLSKKELVSEQTEKSSAEQA